MPTAIPPPPEAGGRVFDYYSIHGIEVRNLRNEHLGRIQDLGIDLENGRLIEVLIVARQGLFTDGNLIAVPPFALLPDPDDQIYRLDISREDFAAAPAIDAAEWSAAFRNDRVAAAYRYFGQEPYFIEAETLIVGAGVKPKSILGYVELTSRIVDLPVSNLQQETLGKVWSIRVDFERGRVLSVIVVTAGERATKRAVPPTALRFNAQRNALSLEDRDFDYEDEPEFIFISSEANPDDHFTQDADTASKP